MTITRTQTKTSTRAELIQVNMEVLAVRLLSKPRGIIDRVIRPGVEQGFIRRLDFWGLDEEGLCHARLSLKVDWAEHNRQVQITSRVRIDGRWVERVAPEVRTLLEGFERAVEQRGLRVRGSISLVEGADRARLQQQLALPTWRPAPWAEAAAQTAFPIKGLTEVNVELNLVDEESR